MTISVIIPAHDRPDLLIQCLRSLAGQTYVPFEVCVVDDGGALDRTAIAGESGADYLLRWTAFPEPRGRSAARNEGLRNATGDIVVFLDSDMEVSPGFLDTHLWAHRDRPGTAALGSIEWPDGGAFSRYIGSRGIGKLTSGDPVPPWYFVTGNASIGHSDLPPDPVFDESIPGWGGEDLDLGMRLHERGIVFVVAPDAHSFHHFDGDLAQHLARTRRYGAEALPMLVRRYPELARVTRVDLLEHAYGWLLTAPLLANAVAVAARSLDKLPLPDSVFDYLTFAAYAHGYRERTRS